jgi:hypothetical protein
LAAIPCALLCLASPIRAEDRGDRDVFEAATGRYGSPDGNGDACRTSLHDVSFSDDRSRAYVHWAQPTAFLAEKPPVEDMVLDVIGHDEGSVTLVMNGDYGYRPDGKLIVWTIASPDYDSGYCWKVSFYTPGACSIGYQRCNPAMLLS